MADAPMAFPELRNPYAESEIHPAGGATVLYQGRKITVTETGPGGLLVDPAVLTEINGFTLKPEGACFEDLCVPVGDGIVSEAEGRTWFNLTAFADLLGQAWVADEDDRVWSFAEIPSRRESTLVNARVPDISLTDRSGNVIRLPDLKGKKALIVTWSSW